MEKRGVVYLALFLLMFPLVVSTDYINAEEVTLNVVMSGGYSIVESGARSHVREVSATFKGFPIDSSRQHVSSLQTSPVSTINDESIIFYWDEPTKLDYDYSITSTVVTEKKEGEIRQKVDFPIDNLPINIRKYVRPSETADSDTEEIILTANEIVKGEDDLFIAVGKIALWTRENIKYSLDTVTLQASQPASYVMQTRYGVCDELTNVFIALSRSVGIPARFITGVAYTDSELFDENWGLHGWAEVYFPGYGWVPYDVAYGQFGYIDQSHIELQKSVDSKDSLANHSWISSNAKVVPKKINVGVMDIASVEGIPRHIYLNVENYEDHVGISSYNLITITVKNPHDFYIVEEVGISKPKEVVVYPNRTQSVILGPKETKKIFYITKTNLLDKKLIYKMPYLITDIFNNTVESSYKVSEGGFSYNREELFKIIDFETNKDKDTFKENIALNCSAEKEEVYLGEPNSVICEIKNEGNILSSGKICYQECKEIFLGIKQQQNVTFDIINKQSGRKTEYVTYESTNSKTSAKFDYLALDFPVIKFYSVDAPDEVEFNENFNIASVFERSEIPQPVDIKVTIDIDGEKRIWNYVKFERMHKIVFQLKGEFLKEGENNIKIELEYKDNRGRTFSNDYEVGVKLVNLTWWQKIVSKYLSFERWIFNKF